MWTDAECELKCAEGSLRADAVCHVCLYHIIGVCMCWCQIGWLTLKEEFDRLLGGGQTDKAHDIVFDDLKAAVRDESMKKHRWDEKAEDSLVRLLLCILFYCFHSWWKRAAYIFTFIIHRLWCTLAVLSVICLSL